MRMIGKESPRTDKKESNLSIVERLLMKKEKEEKQESWLQQLCGDDAELYDVLSSSLPFDPIAALPKEDLGVLIDAAEKSVKDEDYEEAIRKYRSVVEVTSQQEGDAKEEPDAS
jgi:hypothetical protein